MHSQIQQAVGNIVQDPAERREAQPESVRSDLTGAAVIGDFARIVLVLVPSRWCSRLP